MIDATMMRTERIDEHTRRDPYDTGCEVNLADGYRINSASSYSKDNTSNYGGGHELSKTKEDKFD